MKDRAGKLSLQPEALGADQERHARALPHSQAPRQPAESESLMGRVKSWMPEIGTSSLMSGDWKRSYGANCDTGTWMWDAAPRSLSSIATQKRTGQARCVEHSGLFRLSSRSPR